MTCEPSEKRSASGAESEAASRSPIAPLLLVLLDARAVDRIGERIRTQHEDRDPGRAQRRARQRQPPRAVRAPLLPALIVQPFEARLDLRQQVPPARVALNGARHVAHH